MGEIRDIRRKPGPDIICLEKEIVFALQGGGCDITELPWLRMEN